MRSMREAWASAVATRGGKVGMAVVRVRNRPSSWRRVVGAWGERADAQQPAARAVRALVDVEVGDAQPEGLDGFGCAERLPGVIGDRPPF